MELKNIGKMSVFVGILQYEAVIQQSGKHTKTFIEV